MIERHIEQPRGYPHRPGCLGVMRTEDELLSKDQMQAQDDPDGYQEQPELVGRDQEWISSDEIL